MAKFNESIYMPWMRGRFGDFVISRNRYGKYIMPYKKPNNPRTEKQQETRAKMAMLSKLWSSLELWQVVEWDEATHYHNIMNKRKTGYLTGFAFFMRTNMNLMNAGFEPIKECPDRFSEPMSMETINVHIVTNVKYEDMVVTFKPNLDENNVIIVSATGLLRTGRMFPDERKFRRIGMIDWKWNPGFVENSIAKMYKKVFGRIEVSEGLRIGFKFQMMDLRSGKMGDKIYQIAES